MYLLITLIAGLFFLIGVMIALVSKNNKQIINFSMGMCFTVLIMLVALDIIPETLELFKKNQILWIAGGILVGLGLLLVLDAVVPHHDHYEHQKDHAHHLIHIGIMTLVALVIHNVIEGMSIYGVAKTSLKTGIIYALGVGLHNIPFGMGLTMIFNETKSKLKMWLAIFVLTISTFIGGLLIYCFSNVLTDFLLGLILSVTIGMIIYLLIWELLVEIKENWGKYTIIGLVVGFLLMIITFLI